MRSVAGHRVFAGQYLADDRDVLPGTFERSREGLAVPTLDHLRARDAQAEHEAAAGQVVQGDGRHGRGRGGSGRELARARYPAAVWWSGTPTRPAGSERLSRKLRPSRRSHNQGAPPRPRARRRPPEGAAPQYPSCSPSLRRLKPLSSASVSWGPQCRSSSRTVTAGSRVKSEPGSRIFERRTPEPIMTAGQPVTRPVDEDRPVRRQADRRDAAVLHTGQLHGPLHRQERCLADIEIAAYGPVHICPSRRQDHARSEAFGPLSLAADDHTVGQHVRVEPESLLGGGRVRNRRVDLDHSNLVRASPGRSSISVRRTGQEVGPL